MDREVERYINSKDYRRTREVLSRNRSLLSYLRTPSGNEPGASGEFPITNVLFLTPAGRYNNRLAALFVQRHSSEVRLESIPSVGSLEVLSSDSSSGSDSYHTAESSSAWSFVDSEVTLVHINNWMQRARRWLTRYGLYIAVGAAGGCILGYTLARTYKTS
ncbi:hypothetical protein CBL_00037 [Carabus blaptoides fortunei]